MSLMSSPVADEPSARKPGAFSFSAHGELVEPRHGLGASFARLRMSGNSKNEEAELRATAVTAYRGRVKMRQTPSRKEGTMTANNETNVVVWYDYT